MNNAERINPNFVTIDELTDEAIKILNHIDKINSPLEKPEAIYLEIVCRFGAWRIGLARLIQRECRSVVKSSFNFIDKVGKLPRMVVGTKAGMKWELIDGIKRTLDQALTKIGFFREKGGFKSDSPYYFYRYGLEIDLEAGYMSFNRPSRKKGKRSNKKKVNIRKDSQAFIVLKLLLENRGKIVTYEELLKACNIEKRTQTAEEKGMDIFKSLAIKFKKIGIGPSTLKRFMKTNKGYRLIFSNKW